MESKEIQNYIKIYEDRQLSIILNFTEVEWVKWCVNFQDRLYEEHVRKKEVSNFNFCPRIKRENLYYVSIVYQAARTFREGQWKSFRKWICIDCYTCLRPNLDRMLRIPVANPFHFGSFVSRQEFQYDPEFSFKLRQFVPARTRRVKPFVNFSAGYSGTSIIRTDAWRDRF